MKDRIIAQLTEAFSSFSSDLNEIAKILHQSPAKFNPQIWDIIKSIFDILLPVGYSMIALFFIIDFLNKSVMFEYVKWENVIKSLLKMIVAKMVMEHSFELLNVMFEVVTSMLTATSKVGNISGANMNLDKIVSSVNNLDGFMEEAGFYLSIFPMILVMMGIKIAIYVFAYGRIVELYLLTAVAPLPLSTITSDGMQNTAKKFLQTYFAVCLQGLIILIGCLIYGGMMVHVAETADVWDIIKNDLIMSFVLLFLVAKSGTWARQITGVM